MYARFISFYALLIVIHRIPNEWAASYLKSLSARLHDNLSFSHTGNKYSLMQSAFDCLGVKTVECSYQSRATNVNRLLSCAVVVFFHLSSAPSYLQPPRRSLSHAFSFSGTREFWGDESERRFRDVQLLLLTFDVFFGLFEGSVCQRVLCHSCVTNWMRKSHNKSEIQPETQHGLNLKW